MELRRSETVKDGQSYYEVLENVKAKGKYGMKVYNVDGLVTKDVFVTATDE